MLEQKLRVFIVKSNAFSGCFNLKWQRIKHFIHSENKQSVCKINININLVCWTWNTFLYCVIYTNLMWFNYLTFPLKQTSVNLLRNHRQKNPLYYCSAFLRIIILKFFFFLINTCIGYCCNMKNNIKTQESNDCFYYWLNFRLFQLLGYKMLKRKKCSCNFFLLTKSPIVACVLG